MSFNLGQIVITGGALKANVTRDAEEGLRRHAMGDWGDLSDDDKALNDRALVEGDRLLSAYHTSEHVMYWIITEWDRSVTTILLPSEY